MGTEIICGTCETSSMSVFDLCIQLPVSWDRTGCILPFDCKADNISKTVISFLIFQMEIGKLVGRSVCGIDCSYGCVF